MLHQVVFHIDTLIYRNIIIIVDFNKSRENSSHTVRLIPQFSFENLYQCEKSCQVCETLPTTNTTISRREDLIDNNEYCEAWALLGECQANSKYMLLKCQKSCQTSPETISSSTKTMSSMATKPSTNQIPSTKNVLRLQPTFSTKAATTKVDASRANGRSNSNVTSHIIEKLIFFILFDRESFTITY